MKDFMLIFLNCFLFGRVGCSTRRWTLLLVACQGLEGQGNADFPKVFEEIS